MKKWIDFFGRQGLFADLSTVFVIFVGVYSALTIERKVMPNVQFEWVNVTTLFPGSSAEEVERLITNPLEQDLREVEGIKRMISTSMDGQSFIGMQLDPDQTTVAKGKSDIQDIVDRFTDLPEGAEDPVVVSIESKLEPVIQASVSAELPEKDIRQAAKDLEREVESLPGVAKVVIDGLRDIEYRVEAQPAQLRRYQLSLNDLVEALRLQNVNIPGGLIEGRAVPGAASQAAVPRDLIVRTVGEFLTLEDVRSAVVRANALGRPIRVGDVAEVTETFERATVLQRTNGRPSMNLTILKKESADAIDVVDAVKVRIGELKTILPAGVYVDFINDSSYYIRRRLGVLSGNLVIGLALVVLILSMVMPWRVSLITAVGIPFAFLATIYIMDHFDISFNVITMMGLIIVVGMLVDDAVVVTENIVRFIEKGLPPLEAAIKGAQQIWAPVTASVLTTIMAFIPMLVMTGIFGKFVKYIPIAVILALLISLYECFFILPHHLGRWVGPAVLKKRRGGRARLNNLWEQRWVPAYVKLARFCVRRRWLVLFCSFTAIVTTLGLTGKYMKFILFPKDGVEAFIVNMEAPVGTPLHVTQQMIAPVEKEVARVPALEMDDFTTKVGLQRLSVTDPQTKRGSHYAQIIVYLRPELERSRTAEEIVASVRERVGSVPGLVKLSFDQVNPGPPVGQAISIGVNGRNYEDILPVVRELREIVEAQKGAYDVQDNYFEGKGEIRVIVDKAEAAAAGLTVSSIGTAVRSAFEGLVATTIRLLDEEIDVRVSLPENERANEETLSRIQIPNAQGALIPLVRVAQLEKAVAISQYEHENNKRQIKVYGAVDEKVSSSQEVNQAVLAQLPALKKKYPRVSFSFGGEAEDTQESMQSLARAGITAIFGIFMILILTFKNIFQPLLVVATIPLGVVAVIWGFALHGMPMSFLGMVGVIALAGVIVNNSIVFIDFVNKRREEGANRVESIVEAGRMRIRPIFLTTLTTVCGILPTAYGLGGLDQFVVPVAMALGWGMFFGSIQAVIVLPALIAALDDLVHFFRRVLFRLVPGRS